jgi:hypothetical protein
MSHLGIVLQITTSGRIQPNDFYPITHIILSSIIQITRLPLVDICNYSTAIFSILCVLLLYILSIVAINDSYARIIAVSTSIAVIFDRYSLYLMPNGWSIFFMPIVFYLFFRDRIFKAENFKITLLIISLIYPFFHPLSTIYLLMALSVIGFTQLLIHHHKNGYTWNNIDNGTISIKIISFLFISFFMWTISFKFFELNIRSLYFAIISGAERGRFLDTVEVGVSKLGINIVDLVIYIFESMGHVFILLLLSLISFFYFVRSAEYRRPENFPLLAFFAISGLGFILYSGRIFGFLPGTGAIAGQRLISYVGVFVPLLIGYLGGRLLSNRDLAKFLFFALMIFIASVSSIFAFFPSPNLYVPSPHMTNMDICSFSWTITRMEGAAELSSIMSNQKRFIEMIFGADMEKHISTSSMRDHFGYVESNSPVDFVNANKYIVLNKIDKITYLTVWRNVGRFIESDFDKLSNDITKYKLYDNGDGDVWLSTKS